MINEISGDILLSRAAAIAHGVAPMDHFDQGLALALRQQWPSMYDDFRHWCHVHHPAAGDLWAWAGADGKRVVSLLTQDPARNHNQHPGGATQSHVSHALRALHKWVEKEKITSLALPRLATGVGGLEWREVRPLIQQHLGTLTIPVFVYATYVPGLAATETGIH